MDERASDWRRPALVVLAGGAIAAAAVALAALAGGPYLALSGLNPWIVVYAVALFAALFATPFAIHGRLGGRLESDDRWERALIVWGAVALGALALGLVCGLPSGFDSDSLAGAVGLVTTSAAALVLFTLAVWLISG